MGKGLLREGISLSETWLAEGSGLQRTDQFLGQTTSSSVAVQAPQYKNTSPSQDRVALCVVFVHSYSLNTNWSCHLHIQSHMKALDSEDHTDSGDPLEEGLGSGCDQGHYKEPQPWLVAAAGVNGGQVVAGGQYVDLAAFGGQQGMPA